MANEKVKAWTLKLLMALISSKLAWITLIFDNLSEFDIEICLNFSKHVKLFSFFIKMGHFWMISGLLSESYRVHKFENSFNSFFWCVIVVFEFSMISNHWEDSFDNLQHFFTGNWTIIIQIVKSESPLKVSFENWNTSLCHNDGTLSVNAASLNLFPLKKMTTNFTIND